MSCEGTPESDEGSSKNKYGFDLYPDRRRTKPRSWFENVFEYGNKGVKKLQCEEEVLKAVKKNPLVRILINALESAGCPFDIGRHISCEECDLKVTGGYDSEWNQIVVCQNSFKSRKLVCSTLIHELIHMYDYCVNDVDFKNNEHLACSEIRAANIAHCSFLSSFFLSQSSMFDIKNTHRYCVQMKAAQSMMVARNMDLNTALMYIHKVFDKCYNDLEPVGRRIRRNSNDPLLAYYDSLNYGYGKPTKEGEKKF